MKRIILFLLFAFLAVRCEAYQIKQSTTAYPLVFFMADSSDHVTAKTGLFPTVTISKAGGSFASPSGTVTEIANGWYKVAGNATDSATLGPLVLHATGSGADPTDAIYEVVAFDPQDTVRLGLTAMPNVASGNSGALLVDGTGTAALSVSGGRGKADVTYWNASAVASPDTAGYPKVTVKSGTGTGEISLTSGIVGADMRKILTATINENTTGNIATNFGTFWNNNDNNTSTAVASNITSINTKTGYLPSATAGSAGGVTIAGSNAATTFATLTSTGAFSINGTSNVAQTGDSYSRIGSAGAGLTGVPWNASWDAEVQSEADDALVANHLDHLLAAAYDPTSKPGNASALLNVLVENDGGVPRFTTNALEQGPGGGGGGATAQEVWEYATRNLSGTVNDFDELVASASTFDTIVGSSTEWARATAPVLNGTTIATLASQTSFTLTAGSTDNDAYNGGTAIFVDASTAVQKGVSVIDDYTGSTKTVTLASAPPFTIATSDKIYIVAPMGLPAATVTDVSSGASVSAFLVDADHTWTFASRSQTTSPQLITEIRGTGGFNGLVAMDFTVPMPANASISSVGTVGVADETGKTEPTLSAASLSPDKKKVHVPVNATAATAGTYTISVTITTTDSQTFMRKGRLVLE